MSSGCDAEVFIYQAKSLRTGYQILTLAKLAVLT